MSSRRRLKQTTCLIGGAFAAVMVSTPALSQEETVASDGESQVTAVEEIVITGSRIRLADYVQSNPVVSVTSEQIEYSGVTNVTDFMSDYPALVGSFNNQESADTGGQVSVGLNLLNLRNLGTNRTLVLIDGRRHVASDPGSAAIDTNTIPVALIERVEVLTGGASAIYGADGVSGVVNFVMKDDFEGIDLRAQTGWSDEGGGDRHFVSGLIGENFLDGRLNLTFGFEWAEDEALSPNDRSYTRVGQRETLAANPDDLADDPNVPDYILQRNVRYPDTSLGGSVYTDLDFGDELYGFDYQGDGQLWESGQLTNDFTVVGGSGSLLDVFQDEILPAQDRMAFNTSGRYDFAPRHSFFFEGKFVRIETGFNAQPTYDFGYGEAGEYVYTGLWTGLDNPFMPDAIREDALTNPLGLGNPGNAALLGVDPGVFVQRDNLDFGYTGRDITRDTFRTVIGLEGDIGDSGMRYEVSYVWGKTETESTYLNNRLNDRFLAAIDVVDGPNGPVCRSDLDPAAYLANPNVDSRVGARTFTPGAASGCVPLNIFGNGSPSQEALDWIHVDSLQTAEIEQRVFSAFVTGDSAAWFNLPGGPLSFAVGMEQRFESSESRVSDMEALGQSVRDELDPENDPALAYDVSWSGAGVDSSGSFDVSEVFVEFNAPLLSDLPFIQELNLDAAYRYSDYSTAGSTDTWKLGARWRLNDWIMFRATEARSVRAPNIGELFLPRTQTFALLDDPCDTDNQNLGTGNRQANCVAELTALGFDPNNFNNTSSSSIEGIVGGNPDLEAEEADTFTAGFVFTPQFAPGFSLALDYYDIDLSNAIQFFEAQTVVDQCYDLPQPNQFCDLIGRNDSTGFINYFEQSAVNVASYQTSGYDMTIRYNLNPVDFGIERDIGRFNFALAATKLEELVFVELDTPDEQLGFPGAPEWVATFDALWQWRDFAVNYGFTYYDETYRVDPQTLAAEPDYVEDQFRMYSAREQHDVQARWNVNDTFTLYGGVNNFTNQEPDRGSAVYPIGALGRFFYVGGTMRLGAVGDALFWR